jgi:hypothetical protein
VYVEMQDLWLQTRIRRDDYAFLGDLRQLASRSMQEVKVNWARVHATVAARLAGAGGTDKRDACPPAPAWCAPAGAGASQAPAVLFSPGVAQPSRLSPDSQWSASFFARVEAIRQAIGARATEFEASLADLRLRYLPPLQQPSWAGRAVSRLNLFSMRRLRPHPQLHEYWERTWAAGLRLQFWRVNPLRLTWRLARDSREAMIFLFAMWSERY